jgi:hypothetical protein
MSKPTLTVDGFIDALAEGDSSDAEIAGLTEALRAAVAHFTFQQLFAFEKELPAILKQAQETRF